MHCSKFVVFPFYLYLFPFFLCITRWFVVFLYLVGPKTPTVLPLFPFLVVPLVPVVLELLVWAHTLRGHSAVSEAEHGHLHLPSPSVPYDGPRAGNVSLLC